ncbi:hypothetical protein GCM10009819_29390 [Agromyces tropicus]|uniref:DUF5667 domain-containing protein n=1 Tax=Agromyces tropicus TaxID=555371 RepID=A0ABN2URE6_9MICO
MAAIVFAGAAVGARAADLDARARVELRGEAMRIASEIDAADRRALAATALADSAQACIDRGAATLRPVVAAVDRFDDSIVRAGTSAILAATSGARETAGATVLMLAEDVDGSRDELARAVVELEPVRAEAGARELDARLHALERDAVCRSATRTVDRAMAALDATTATLISANPKAEAAVVAELRAARGAALDIDLERADAAAEVDRWLAAAGALERSQREAVDAEERAAAEEAARRAAAEAEAAAEPEITYHYSGITCHVPDDWDPETWDWESGGNILVCG